MYTITTTSVQNRPDWYQATAFIGQKVYNAFHSTRDGALVDVLKQLKSY